MVFTKDNDKFILLLRDITYQELSYLKECLEALKELSLPFINREILGEGTS